MKEDTYSLRSNWRTKKESLIVRLKRNKEEDIVEEKNLKDIIMGSQNCHFKERPTSQGAIIKQKPGLKYKMFGTIRKSRKDEESSD